MSSPSPYFSWGFAVFSDNRIEIDCLDGYIIIFLEEWENTLFQILYRKHGKCWNKNGIWPLCLGTKMAQLSKFIMNACLQKTFSHTTSNIPTWHRLFARYLIIYSSWTCTTSIRGKHPLGTLNFFTSSSEKNIGSITLMQRAIDWNKTKAKLGWNDWGLEAHKATCPWMSGGYYFHSGWSFRFSEITNQARIKWSMLIYTSTSNWLLSGNCSSLDLNSHPY